MVHDVLCSTTGGLRRVLRDQAFPPSFHHFVEVTGFVHSGPPKFPNLFADALFPLLAEAALSFLWTKTGRLLSFVLLVSGVLPLQ